MKLKNMYKYYCITVGLKLHFVKCNNARTLL